jgi:hypothetical protein
MGIIVSWIIDRWLVVQMIILDLWVLDHQPDVCGFEKMNK